MTKTITLPSFPDRGSCDPEIESEPVEFPTEVPERIDVDQPIEAPGPFRVPEKVPV